MAVGQAATAGANPGRLTVAARSAARIAESAPTSARGAGGQVRRDTADIGGVNKQDRPSSALAASKGLAVLLALWAACAAALAEGHGDAAPAAPPSAPRADAAVSTMDAIRERLAQRARLARAREAKQPAEARAVEAVDPKASRLQVDKSLPLHAMAAAANRVERPAPAPRIHEATRSRRTSAAPAALAAPEAASHEVHWSYDGAGAPPSWASLKPEFAACSNGLRQSPIDIRDGVKVDLDPVRFDYRPGGFRVVDNGHTIQVNVASGSSIEVLGRRYELVQFHFHRPSEERIDGRQFDMVVHLVHKNLDGKLAVVAVLLERGSTHAAVQKVWNNLPLEKGDEVAARSLLDPTSLLPTERGYFTYMGSLTTPPCSEGVLWMVMKTPQTLSAEQIGIFARLYPMNARPLQQASARLIKESN